jgi:threonine/homoserine/homoserine lactone efflux protein
VLTFVAIGVAAGILTGIPIGPVNVAVIDAAYRHTVRRALAVGFGGAVADCLYATLGVLGITPILKANPAIPPILNAVSGLVLVIYGVLTARSRPVSPIDSEAPRSPNPSKEMWSGFTVGVALIFLNPAALVTWVIMIGKFIPDASTQEGLATAGGILVGSFLWFSLVAFLTHRGKHLLGETFTWIPRLLGVGLICYGLYLEYVALRYYLL